MKKNLYFLLLFFIILTGCKKDEINIPYEKAENIVELQAMYETNGKVADYLSKDLTIIPVQRWDQDEYITASSSLFINHKDKELIYADNIYKRMYPASLTKLLTALVVIEKGNLDDLVSISSRASNILEDGAKLSGFRKGDLIDLESLLNIFLVYSGNDAGMALAEHISGSEEAFVNEMNKTAKRIGAVHSNFVNSHGLHDLDHYTTAYDLYLIFNELLNHEELVSIISKSSFIGEYITVDGTPKSHQFMNTNRYLLGRTRLPEHLKVIGGKTGTTSEAGNCLSLYSEGDGDKDYISIILQVDGGDELYNQMTYLLNMVE